MSIISYFTIPLLAFFLVMIDTSFFSFNEIFGATIISSFCILLVLAIFGYRKQSLLFAATAILCLTAFSSLPVYILIAAFLLIPLLIFYLKNKVFFENSFLAAIVIFFVSTLLFRLLMLPLSVSIDQNLISSVIFFPILNVIFCIIVFVSSKKVITYFKP